MDRQVRRGVSAELALRVYSARLLGADPRLVLHGGGNASVKVGDVLHVTASGRDLARVQAAHFPALRLGPLRRLAERPSLDEPDLIPTIRAHLIDEDAPTPSVETPLHAWLPDAYVDHTHPNAVLTLADQTDAEGVCRRVFADRAAIVPYAASGFELARVGAAAAAAHPESEGLVLLRHGLVTYGRTALEGYERTVRLVTLAEDHIRRHAKPIARVEGLPSRLAEPASVARVLREVLAAALREGPETYAYEGRALAFRTGPAIVEYTSGAEIERYANAGPVTPGHLQWTGPWPLIAPPARAGELAAFREELAGRLEAFRSRYAAYVERYGGRTAAGEPRLSLPRVLLVPGLGLYAVGTSEDAAEKTADLAAAAAEVIRDAEAIGRYESLDEATMFEAEYGAFA